MMDKRRNFRLFLMLITLSGLITACGAAFERPAAPVSQSIVDAAGEEYYEYPAEAPAGAPEPAPTLGYADGQSVPIEEFLASAVAQPQETRVIIYTGDISLVVRDTQEAIDAITVLTSEEEGYVANSNIYQSADVLRGTITIRVPAVRYQDMLARLRDLALRVERESSSTQDVTEEFVDLQARKTNLEFTEEALQKLLDERQRVGSTSDILEVHRELTNIRGQIEQIEGRLRYLANQSALSTITIELIPDVLYQPISVGGWEPQGVAKEALQTLVAALQGLVNVLIWVVIFVLPLLIIFLAPVALVIWLIRWWWKRHKARKETAKQTVAAPNESSKDQ
jgi:hypothetical protein